MAARRFYFNGPKFRTVREGRRLSLVKLSRQLWSLEVEATPETIRTWEIGASEPRAAQLYTAAQILQIPAQQLMTYGPATGRTPG